jgi:hypothetical protein
MYKKRAERTVSTPPITPLQKPTIAYSARPRAHNVHVIYSGRDANPTIKTPVESMEVVLNSSPSSSGSGSSDSSSISSASINQWPPRSDPTKTRCYDWIIGSGDTHYARDRESFATYRPLETEMSSLKVLGVGTIVLEVFRSPLRDKYRELILHNVLHTPESLCNTFSIELYEGYYHRGQHIGQGSDIATRPMFYTRPFLHNLQRLVLKNEPLGCSPLTEAHEKGRIPFAKAIRLDEKNRKVLESVILRGHTHSLPEPVRLPPSLSILLEEMQEDRNRENAALARLIERRNL